jgi:HK97 family phage major capsid protein
MVANISRITTGTTVTAQTAENTSVSNTDADDTNLAVNIRTYSGQQDVSRQSIERGTGVDSILIQDLVSAYWTELNADVVNGGGTGEHTGVLQTGSIQSVTYTDTTATVGELYPKLADLIQKIQTGVYQGITHFVMHPRRWWWIAKELSTSHPLVSVPMAGNQQAGSFGGTGYNNTQANIFGVPVVLDATVPTTLGSGTNEDVILGVSSPEMHLWHDDSAPLFIRAEGSNAGQLQVKFVVYGYSAFTAGRYPGAHGKIAGTGLTTPSF